MKRLQNMYVLRRRYYVCKDKNKGGDFYENRQFQSTLSKMLTSHLKHFTRRTIARTRHIDGKRNLYFL